jgi:3-hydroxyisobutyrate dehydrogenase-like beta-hydroxyacid dehydrogenase
MATMLEVLETSSGQSAATSDKFQKHVLTGRYAAGFTNSLMAKDVRLYLCEAEERVAAISIGQVVAAVGE